MRIAIFGSAGCGKTTLAGALAARLGVAVVPEMFEGFFDDQGQFLKPDGLLARKMDEVLEAKHRLEAQAGDFVADRCPVDLFGMWLVHGFSAEAEATATFERKCRHYAAGYDALVLPPWGMVPLAQLDPATTRHRRVMDPWKQFRGHCMALGMALHWLPARRVIAVPPDVRATGERCEFVLRACDARKLGVGAAEA
jgi:predicted ATPase